MKISTLHHITHTKLKTAYTAIILFTLFNISNAQITLTAPSQNAALTEGSPITISANVTVSNVGNVTFWVDNDEGNWKWIGKATTSPYQVTNYIVKPGTNKIRARVTYSGGTADTAIDVSTNDNGGGRVEKLKSPHHKAQY